MKTNIVVIREWHENGVENFCQIIVNSTAGVPLKTSQSFAIVLK